MMVMLMEIREKVVKNGGVERTTALRDRRTEYAHSNSDRKQMYTCGWRSIACFGHFVASLRTWVEIILVLIILFASKGTRCQSRSISTRKSRL